MRKRTKTPRRVTDRGRAERSLLVTSDSAASSARRGCSDLAAGRGGRRRRSCPTPSRPPRPGSTCCGAVAPPPTPPFAVAATLGVTDPFVAGIGGGGYLVYYDARTHRVHTIDGRETTPAAGDQPVHRSRHRQAAAVPDRGHQRAVRRRPRHADDLAAGARTGGARFSLAHGPAARPSSVAQQGFPVTATLPRAGPGERRSALTSSPPPARCSCRAASCRAAGSTFRNPDLARTYREIGRQGVGALYGGPLGATVVGTVQHLPLAPGATVVPRPGPDAALGPAALHRAVRAPTHVHYRGYDVYGMAPVLERRHHGRRVPEHLVATSTSGT